MLNFVKNNIAKKLIILLNDKQIVKKNDLYCTTHNLFKPLHHN